MKNLFLFLPFILLFSCSVQKRKYQPGYYVNWHNKAQQKENTTRSASTLKTKQSVKEKEAVSEEILTSTYVQPKDQEVLAFAGKSKLVREIRKSITLFLPPEDSCDVLVFKDGSEIKVRVNEIGINEIKYKRCDTPDGPVYISRKSELFMIKYANGTREVIKSDAVQPQVLPQRTSTPSYKQQKVRRETHPLAIASLILGIMAVVLAYITIYLIAFGFGIGVLALPFLAGLAAVISGKSAMNRIREQPDVFRGKGLALPGYIMGMIIVAIYITVFGLIALFSGL